nr:AAA domain-containing protein [Pseudomonas aeruginosa]
MNNLIGISQDWIDVLGSGAANYDKFLVKTSQLVCGTLVGIGAGGIHIEEMEFDWVIVDEAGRAQASELMIAMQCGRRVLLVGDHKQLAPCMRRNIYERSPGSCRLMNGRCSKPILSAPFS